MALQLDNIDDFVAATQTKENRLKFTDLSAEFTSYDAVRLIAEKGVTEEGGRDIGFRVVTDDNGSFHMTGLFAADQTGTQDKIVTGNIPWRFATASWSYDKRAPMFQSSRETVIKLLQVERHSAKMSMVKGLESQMWSAPASSSDTDNAMGIPFWMQKDASTTPEGDFNGGNPSGWSGGAAGIDSTTTEGWRNYTFGYSAVTTDDLVRKVKRALVFTDWQAPSPYPELRMGKMERCIYTTYAVEEPLQRLAETRNENHGSDLARFMSGCQVGGVPVKTSMYLEANDTSNPLYGVDFGVLRPFVQRQLNMVESKPRPAPRQNHVSDVFIDLGFNFGCINRRRLWVGSVA